jgi:hypothetical protein
MGKFNYAKYKRRKENKTYYVIVIAILIVSLSVGYSLFSETLSISGTASTGEYVDDKLAVTITQSGGRYVTATYGQNVTFGSETYDGENNLTIYLNRANTRTQLRNTTLTINFRNPYANSLTAGSASSVIVSGAGNFGTATATVGNTTVASNGTSFLRLALSMRTSVAGPIQVDATYQYTYLGTIKYFYFTMIVT